MKRNNLFIIVGLIAILMSLQVYQAQAVDEIDYNNISQNCSSIKQSLTQLQHADSRTRTYLGSAYERIARDFIAPLNLRLSKNNRSTEDIANIEKQFIKTQADFRNSYTEYMRELDGLIATDCQAHPQDFYAKLEQTREKRAQLRKTVESLTGLIKSQTEAVTKLQESL